MNNSKDALVNYYDSISNADLEKISTCFDLPAKLISLYGVVDMLSKKDIITTYDKIIKTWNNQGILNKIGYDADKFEITHVQNNIDLIQTELKNYDFNGSYIQTWRSIYILRQVNTRWVISLATSDNKRSSSIKNKK
tara:strand:+ start:108 stop:518 length:411 start_codon:yes stop_codon:yes gene_type:complete